MPFHRKKGSRHSRGGLGAAGSKIARYIATADRQGRMLRDMKRFATDAENAATLWKARTQLNKGTLGWHPREQGAYYTGHGSYKNKFKGLAAQLARRAGHTALGFARAEARRFGGVGAYNSLITGGGNEVTDQVASFNSADDETGAVEYTHREYVTDVYGTGTAFNVQSYAINPGLEAMFPWGSQLGVNYEEYELKQMMVSFRSTVSDIGSSTNGQVGTVIMATNYNAAAQPFADKVTMMEYDGAMSCKSTEHMTHGIECDPGKLSSSMGKYIRAGPVPMGQDPKTYDHGLFQFATANTPTSYNGLSIGELWVSYTVILRKPRFFSNKGLAIARDMFVGQPVTSGANFVGTGTTTGPWGADNLRLKAQQNNIGCLVANTGSLGQTRVTFPAQFSGNVRVQWLITVAGPTAPLSVPTTAGNISLIADVYGGQPAQSSAVGEFVTDVNVAGWLDINVQPATGGVNNSLLFTSTTMGSNTVSAAAIEIFEINGSFIQSAANTSPLFVNPSNVVVTPV